MPHGGRRAEGLYEPKLIVSLLWPARANAPEELVLSRPLFNQPVTVLYGPLTLSAPPELIRMLPAVLLGALDMASIPALIVVLPL